ncbi:MAG: ATP-binding protein, partial [Ilumatobacteraceae bacterium]
NAESRRQALLTNISDIITVMGPNGEWISTSGAGSRMLGWASDIDPDAGIFALVHPDDAELALRALAEVIDGTRTSDQPVDLRVMDTLGEYHVLETFGENMIDNELIRGVVLTSRDVTAARAAQTELQESTGQLSALLSSLADGVLFLDADRRVLLANQSFLNIFEISGSPDELIGFTTSEVGARFGVPYADSEGTRELAEQRYRDIAPTLEELVTLLDGRVVERDSIPVHLADGRREHLWVFRDVTEREELSRHRADMLDDSINAQQRAEEQHRALLAITEMRSQFVATISHELRTPLASILGFAELLRGDLEAAGWMEQVTFVDAIDRNGKRLLRLVNDLLLMRQLELGALPLERTTGTVDALVRGAIETLEPMAAARRQQLRGRVEPGPPLTGDFGRLDQVLVNLLSNSVKFTPEGGTITVDATHDESHWTIAVTDNGPGIPPHEQAGLFQNFYRAASNATSAPGTGLGLAISKAVVELHGGTVGIDSEVGVGTTVTIRLPFAE